MQFAKKRRMLDQMPKDTAKSSLTVKKSHMDKYHDQRSNASDMHNPVRWKSPQPRVERIDEPASELQEVI